MKKLFFTLFVLALLQAALPARAQETYKFAERDTCSLYLDIWRPAQEAVRTIDGQEKPTVLFVFGGGFIMGSRNDQYTSLWYQHLNSEGYPVVAIDYRLGMKGYKMKSGFKGLYESSEQFLKSQQMGVEDVFSAISFLAENREQLGIDTGNIVIAGSSAGAIISLASAYAIANGETEGLPEGFRFKGVMSFAGAIISNSGAPKFKTQPCPLLLLHGTADQAVAYHHYGAFGRGLWGSDYLAEQLQKKGWPCCIYRFKDRTHDVAAYMRFLWPVEKDFLEKCATRGLPVSIDAQVDDPSLPTWSDTSISLDDIYKKNR